LLGFLWLCSVFTFFLGKKSNKKSQGRAAYIPFLPGSFIGLLYYCGFNIGSLLLNSMRLVLLGDAMTLLGMCRGALLGFCTTVALALDLYSLIQCGWW